MSAIEFVFLVLFRQKRAKQHTAHYLLAFDGDDHLGPFTDLSFGTKIDCIMGSIAGRPAPM